jgi:hypothetical protein
VTPGDLWTQQLEAFGRFSTAQQEAIAATEPTQQAIVEAVQAWARTVEKLVPAVPAGRLDGLPGPREALRDSIKLAHQLLAAQRDFAEGVLAAIERLRTKQA